MHCLIITKAQASWIMHATLSMSFAWKNGTKKLRGCKNERKILFFSWRGKFGMSKGRAEKKYTFILFRWLSTPSGKL